MSICPNLTRDENGDYEDFISLDRIPLSRMVRLQFEAGRQHCYDTRTLLQHFQTQIDRTGGFHPRNPSPLTLPDTQQPVGWEDYYSIRRKLAMLARNKFYTLVNQQQPDRFGQSYASLAPAVRAVLRSPREDAILLELDFADRLDTEIYYKYGPGRQEIVITKAELLNSCRPDEPRDRSRSRERD